MSKVYDTWENLLGKIRGYFVPVLEVDGSGLFRNQQGDDSGNAYVDGGTRAASAIAYHASIASDVDLTGAGNGHARRLIVGTSGDLVVTVGGDTVTIAQAVIDASPVLDIEATTIVASGTTAAAILVMW